MKKQIICKKCLKIIMEGEFEEIIKMIGNDEYIECPYCFYQFKSSSLKLK